MAYSRGDAYLQSISGCNNYSELINITHQMYEDFIRCVHNLKKAPVLSPAIQTCCDYIHTHLEEKLSLSGLARRAGYTEYYLSRKFTSETGSSIGDYIKSARIEQAKLLLANSDMDIAAISEKLCFSSRNFFSKVFREKTDITPAAYRASHQK